MAIIAWDFNFDLLSYNYNNLTNYFLSVIYSTIFQPCTVEPTRANSNNRPSLLDNIFINMVKKPIVET